MSHRIALFYKNDVGTMSYRVLSREGITDESTDFSMLGSPIHIADFDDLGIAPLPDPTVVADGGIKVPFCAYYCIKMREVSGSPKIIWRFLSNIEKQPVTSLRLYNEILESLPNKQDTTMSNKTTDPAVVNSIVEGVVDPLDHLDETLWCVYGTMELPSIVCCKVSNVVISSHDTILCVLGYSGWGGDYPAEALNKRHPKFSSLGVPHDEWLLRYQTDSDIDVMQWFTEKSAAITYIDFLVTPTPES
jgi:hypothetical protein